MRKQDSLVVLLSFVFFSIFNSSAFAAAPDRVATSGNKTWASSGVPTLSTLVSQAQSTNNLDLHGQVVTVKNNGTAYDGTVLGNKNIFSIGNITDSLGSASSAFVTTTARTSNLTVGINSININGSMTVMNRNIDDAANTTNVTGSLDVGGSLSIVNFEDDTDVHVDLTVGGDFTSWGDVWLVADTGDTGADATLTLNGTNNSFLSSGVSLSDVGDGRAILTFSGASDQVVIGAINGYNGDSNGIVNVNGAGDTLFNDDIGSTYSLRELNIASAVTKTAEFDGTVDASTITMDGDGAAQFDAAVTATSLYLNSTGTTTLNAASAITTTRLNDAATLGLNAALAGNVDNNGNLLTVSSTGTGQVNGIISGAGGLTKTGAGTLVLNGTNTYTGTTTISAGTLLLASSGAIVNTGTVALGNVAGAKLLLGVNKTIGALSGGGALGGNVDLQSHRLTVSGSSTTTYAGAISGTGGLTKSGTGSLTLSGTNTYTGTTTINKGTLILSGGSAIADTGSVVLANAAGTTLRVNSNESIGFLSGGGTTGGNVVLQGGSRLSLLGDGSAKTFAGIISGNGSLLKTGTSTLTLAGANTYSSGTILDDGMIILGNNSALGTGTLALTSDNGIVASNDSARSISNIIDFLSHDLTFSGSCDLALQGLVWDSIGGGQLIVDMNSDSNTLALYGNNTYDGGTVINRGQIYLGHDNALGTGDLTFSGDGILRSGSDARVVANDIDLDGNNLTILGAFDLELSGDISDTSGGGSLALNMDTASNTLTLSGANVAIEDTFVALGNLVLNTDLTGDVGFLGDALVVVSSGQSITGAVDNLTSVIPQGTLALSAGDQGISGNIGDTSALKMLVIGSGLGETATLSGNVNAQTIEIVSNGTAVFGGDVSGDIDFDADGIVTLANGKSLTGDLSSGSGQGTLTLLGAHNIYGNIGSSLLGNNGLKLVTVGNGLVTIDGDVRALAVNFADDNELRILAGHNIMGAVTTTTGGRGTLTFLGATSTGGDIGQAGSALKVVNFNGATYLSNDIYAANTYIKSGSTVTMTGDTTITGNLTVNNATDAALDLGLSTLDLAGTGQYTQSANSKLKIALSDADWGRISAAGIATISAASTLEVDVNGLTTSGDFTIVDAAAGGAIGDLTVTWDSPLFTIRKTISAEDLIIRVTRFKTYAQMASNPNAAAVARVLDGLVLTATGDMQNVLGQLDDMESSQQISNALDSMTPIIDGGQTAVSNELLNSFIRTAVLRLQDSKVEEKPQDRNYQLYNASLKNDIWAQSYGDYVHQGKRGLSNGYRARIWGGVLGIDRLFMEGALRLGLAGGFGSGRIRSKDNAGRTSIDSYQAALYGEYDNKDRPYTLDAVLSYGYNDYDSSRHVSVGAIDRTARSDYSGQQFSSYLEAGYKFKNKGFDIIPLLALDYTYLYLSDYTEFGADALNLSVNSQTYNSLRPGIGCRLSKAYETKGGIFTPEIRFRYFYDVLKDSQETIASFAGGGTSFRSVGYRPAPSSYNIGARLEFFNKKNITILADANTILKDDYYEVGGSLTVKYSF